MVRRKGVLTNLSWLYTAEFLIRIGSFLLIVFLARYLGDYNLGVYSYAFSLAGLVISFMDFGILTYMIKEIAKDKSKAEKFYKNIATMRFVLGILSLAILFIITLLISKTAAESKIVMLAGFALFFNYSGFAFRSLFQAYEDMKHIAIAQIIERSIAIGLGTYVLMKGLSLDAFVTILILSYFSFFMYLLITTRKIMPFSFSFDMKFWKKALVLSMPFWFTEIFFTIYFKIDAIMLPLFKNFEVTGWYSAAYKIIEGLGFIPILAVMVLFPAMSRLYGKKKDELKELYRKSMYYIFALVLPIAIAVFMLADRFILFFYRQEFTHSIYALQILIFSLIFMFLNYIMGFLLNAIDRQKFFTYAAAIGAFLNIALNALFIPLFTYGYPGAAIATVATQFFNFAALLFLTRKFGFTFNIWNMVKKPLIAAIVMGISIVFMKSFHVIIIMLIGSLVYGIVLMAIKGIEKDEINNLKKKIKEISWVDWD